MVLNTQIQSTYHIDEPDLDELLNEFTQLEFTYPFLYKLFFGIGGIIMFGLPILSMAAKNLRKEPASEIVTATFSSLIGLICLYFAYRLIGCIIITDTHIILSRFGQEKKLNFSQIEHIHNRKINRSLIIKGSTISIRMEKQLQHYGLVYDIIMHKTGHLARKQNNLEFPVVLTSKKRQYWWIGGIFLVGLFLSVRMALDYFQCLSCFQSSRNLLTLLFFPVLIVGWLGLWAGVFVHVVHKVKLLPETIIIGNLYGEVKLPTSILLGLAAQKKFTSDDDPYYDLEMRFHKEEIKQLQKTWNLYTKYFWRNLSNLSDAKEENIILLSGNQFNRNFRDVYDFIVQNYLSNTG